MFSCEIFLTLGHDPDTNATTVQTHTYIYITKRSNKRSGKKVVLITIYIYVCVEVHITTENDGYNWIG